MKNKHLKTAILAGLGASIVIGGVVLIGFLTVKSFDKHKKDNKDDGKEHTIIKNVKDINQIYK